MTSFNKLQQPAMPNETSGWNSLQNVANAKFNPSPSEKILQRTQIDGDPVTINGNNYILTPDILHRMNLGPRHEVNIGNVKIGLSENFQIDSRDATIGYVMMPNGAIKARSYYRSNSSGLWRYLPDYVAGETGRYEWFGKGYDEESTTLPFELQKKLNEIRRSKPIDTKIDPSLAFFGTAKRYLTKQEHGLHLSRNTLRGDYYREVSSRPAIKFISQNNHRIPPEYLTVTDQYAPNFAHEISASGTHNPLYGDQTIRLFESFNRRMRYLMCETTSAFGEPRAWVGGIELNAPITSTGCRSNWVQAGDLGTPLYEYRSQTDGYGDPIDTKGNYQSMWEYYLQRSPLIKNYMNRPR